MNSHNFDAVKSRTSKPSNKFNLSTTTLVSVPTISHCIVSTPKTGPPKSSWWTRILFNPVMGGMPSWSTPKKRSAVFGVKKRKMANLMKSVYAVLFDCIYSIPPCWYHVVGLFVINVCKYCKWIHMDLMYLEFKTIRMTRKHALALFLFMKEVETEYTNHLSWSGWWTGYNNSPCVSHLLGSRCQSSMAHIRSFLAFRVAKNEERVKDIQKSARKKNNIT